MWLLKLHFLISVLCLLIFFSTLKFGRFRLSKNGWGYPTKGFSAKKMRVIFGVFIPVLNVLIAVTAIVMISMKKKDFDKTRKGTKKNKED